MSSHDTPIVAKSQAQYEYDRHHNAVHMRKQVINFAIMIFFTFIAFAVVATDFSKYLIMPFVLLLAGVQVVLQLYSFMHLEDKNSLWWCYWFLHVDGNFNRIYILLSIFNNHLVVIKKHVRYFVRTCFSYVLRLFRYPKRQHC